VKRVLIGAALIGTTACTPAPQPQVTPAPLPAASEWPIHVGIGVGGDRRVVSVPLEEYVLASVLSEFSPPAGDVTGIRTMYAVQSIVARTYAVTSRGRHRADNFDVCNTTHCQLVDLDRPRRSRWAALAREAVEATRGELLRHAGRPASVLFHSDCGGHRAAADEVWGGRALPYLTAGRDPLPSGGEHLTWRFEVDRDALRAALNTSPRTSVGARLDTIDVYRRDASGRAALLLLNGERAPLVRGEEFRMVVSRHLGATSIRSALFDVVRTGSRFVFEGRGFGHGVGLCQRGALARAAAGESVEDILAFYFPGASGSTAAPSAQTRPD
jgi:stage II sporulation protein D